MTDEHLISLQPGTVIAGRFEVVKCLGAGSMGLVYACRHRELTGHLVAVKVLFPEVSKDKVSASRFQNEIKASYGVSHPNVVRAYEYLRDGDLVAYSMEYVGGGDLAEKLSNKDDLLQISEIIKILSQMCAGVQAIHDAGIIHRDLKPENILLTKEGNVKIADFGIARTNNGPKLTEHGGVVGTIDYVSPEYMMNSQVDWRSDIYAIGILGYEMVAGESPFRGNSVYDTMTKRLKCDPVKPSSIRLDCPKELDEILLKAMIRNPEERYQSAAEMFYDLRSIAPEVVNTPVPLNAGNSSNAHNNPKIGLGPVSSGIINNPQIPTEKTTDFRNKNIHNTSLKETEYNIHSNKVNTNDFENNFDLKSNPINSVLKNSNHNNNQGIIPYDPDKYDNSAKPQIFDLRKKRGNENGNTSSQQMSSNQGNNRNRNLLEIGEQYNSLQSNVDNSGTNNLGINNYSDKQLIVQPIDPFTTDYSNEYYDNYNSRGNNSNNGYNGNKRADWIKPNPLTIDDSRTSKKNSKSRIHGEDKSEQLSEIINEANSSVILDALTLFVAVLVGIGVGFTVLKLYFPEIVSDRSPYSVKK